MALRELLAVFGVDVEDKALDAFDKKIGGVEGALKQLGQSIASAFTLNGITQFTKSAIEMGDTIGDTATQAGVSADELQRLGYAIQLSGGSAEGAADALKFLSKNVAEALEGNATAVKNFQDLGVSLDVIKSKQSVVDLLPVLAGGVNALGTEAQKTAASLTIFGRGGLNIAPLLKKTGVEVTALFEEFDALGLSLSSDFLDKAGKAADALDRFGFISKATRAVIASSLIEPFEKVTKTLIVFYRWVNGLLKGTAIPLIAGIGAMGIALKGLVGPIQSVIRAFGGFTKFNLYLLLFAGMVLIVEDLYQLFTGGESAIGGFLSAFLGVGPANELLAQLKGSGQDLMAAFEQLKPLLIELGGVMIEAFRGAIPYIGKFLSYAIAAVTAAVSLVAGAGRALEAITRGDWKGFDKAVSGALDRAGKAFLTVNAAGTETIRSIPTQTPAYLTGQGFTPMSMAQQNSVTINVQAGAGDRETARTVATAVTDSQREFSNTLATIPGSAP